MAGSIKGIVVEIGGDTSALQNALKKVNSSTASLSKELRGINSLLKLDPKNTELVSQKQIVLKQNIEQTSKKLEELKNAQELADKKIAEGGEISQDNYRKLQREIINTENKLKQMKVEASRWTTAGRSIEEFGNKIKNISDKVSRLGTTLTTSLTLPILGIATELVNEARKFETAFTGVEKTVDGTAEQMAKLKQGIKDLSEEIPSSTTEISEVAEAAGQLGIQTDNVLDFTKTMINMGNATNLSADEAATTLARFANVTKMSQSDFDKLGSVIVALGNNFATTEAEISAMGMNLASAGTQVGMSQSQIMGLATALSSVGLEAQAGGTAFSKVMVNMQLAVEKGGKNLKNFASVAGMSSKEFQKAFKEDASNAIMQFVDGLSKSGKRGKSTIKVLDDMGITETRLRDALLRSANASQVMDKAIKLGNKAWKDNTALTNEANKRYQTLDSRLEMTKNKLKNVATNTGDKLTPTFNELLDKVDGLIDRFGGLNEEETKNVLKTAGIVAAIGPAIKIIGVFGSGIGNVTKGVGIFSQAIAVAKNNTTSDVGAVNMLASAMKFLKTPVGLATTDITLAAGAMIYFYNKETEAQKEAREFAEEMSNSRRAMEDYNKSIDETTDANLSHINSVEKLSEELKGLVDENGKVKKGYESRVDFILKEMNEALGTEYKLNGNVVESYKNIQKEIDKTIEKKRAEIKLKAEEEKYSKAQEMQEDAVLRHAEAQKKLGMSYDEAKRKLEEYDEKVHKAYMQPGIIGIFEGNRVEKEKNALQELIKAYEDTEYEVKDYTEQIKKYESDYELFAQEKYTSIGQIVTNTTKNWSDKSLEQIKNSINEEGTILDRHKSTYERTGNDIALQLSQQAQNNLSMLAEELAKRTTTIGALGEEEVEAWKNMATNSFEAYSEQVSKMPTEMQQKIQEATGVIAGGTPEMQKLAGTMGQKTVNEFDKNAEARQKALKTITGYLNGLDDKSKRELLRQAGIKNVDVVIKELDKGNLSEENGKNILQGLWRGLNNGSLTSKIIGVASGLAKKVNKAFTGKDGWDEHSPSKKMKKYAENYIKPISTVMKSKEKGIVNTAKNLVEKINKEFEKSSNQKSKNKLDSLYKSMAEEKINSLKTANKVSKVEEVKYWETLVKYTKKGTKGYTTAINNLNKAKNNLKKEVSTVTKTYVSEVKKVNEELNKNIADLRQKYSDSVNNRKEQIMGSLNLFDNVNFDKAVSKESLMSNLQNQVNALKEWDNTLDALRKRLGNSDLLKELEEQGVGSLNTLKNLNSMSNEELKQYNNLYNQKNAIALDRSKTENEELLKTTNIEIANLKTKAKKQIDSLTDTYKKELKNLGITSKSEGKDIGKQITAGISSGMTSGMKGLSKSMKTQIEKLVKGVKKELKIKSPSRVFRDEIGQYMALGIGVGFENGISKVYNQMGNALNSENNNLLRNLNNIPIGIEQIKNFGKLQDSINSQVTEITKTIFTTPQITFNVQELDSERLEQCFNYVNKKFGSQY